MATAYDAAPVTANTASNEIEALGAGDSPALPSVYRHKTRSTLAELRIRVLPSSLKEIGPESAMSLRSNRVTAGEVFQGSFTILEAGVEGQRAEFWAKRS